MSVCRKRIHNESPPNLAIVCTHLFDAVTNERTEENLEAFPFNMPPPDHWIAKGRYVCEQCWAKYELLAYYAFPFTHHKTQSESESDETFLAKWEKLWESINDQLKLKPICAPCVEGAASFHLVDEFLRFKDAN